LVGDDTGTDGAELAPRAVAAVVATGEQAPSSGNLTPADNEWIDVDEPDTPAPEASGAADEMGFTVSDDAPAESGSEAPDSGGQPVAVGRVQPPGRLQAASLHVQPSTSASTVTMVRAGTVVELLGETASGSGYTWARIRTPQGLEGWLIAAAIRQE
jgi:hypothetical protein